MTLNDKDETFIARFNRALTRAFPDADIDADDDELNCSYGETGVWIHGEDDDNLVIEVNYPFPVVKESDLSDDWGYFKMQFVSDMLEQVAQRTLLKTEHGWEELDSLCMGCPVDWGGAQLSVKEDVSDQLIEQIIEDLGEYFCETRINIRLDGIAQEWFVAKCKQLGLKSSYDLSVPLAEKHEYLVGIGDNMLAGPRDEVIPQEYKSSAWIAMMADKIAPGQRFYFAENKGTYLAYDNYLISVAHRILSLAIEPMLEISQNYKPKWLLNEKGTLCIQLKGEGDFSPWFLIKPYDFSSAKELEPKEPLITQRAGLLRAALGESRIPNIDFKMISADEFEELCCDLLIARGFNEIERRGTSKSRDSGVDITCNIEVPTSFGKKTRKIIVQCKKMGRTFGKSDYDKLHYLELLNSNNADEFIVMCSSDPTKDVLELAYASQEKLRIIGNTRLREQLVKFPEILSKYSSKIKFEC